uniref:L-tryptophan decarboxylase PsiD-like domain-containing protein n=1 Tax=Clytia hemisphaerica TaxID=252671 RepID=A0A7M6DRM9_9CNID
MPGGGRGRRRVKAIPWLPHSRAAINNWLGKKLAKLKKDSPEKFSMMKKYFPAYEDVTKEMQHLAHINLKKALADLSLHASVAKLVVAIATDSTICMFFHNMYLQQSENPPEGGIWVATWQDAVLLINQCVNEAPEFDEDVPIPVPMNAILNVPMSTSAGHAAFLNDKVNAIFKDILNEWGHFLLSKYSCDVLDDQPNHWFSPKALEAMPDFVDTYVCDPDAKHYGYTSFDDFFVRKLKPGARPVEDEDKSVVVAACEAAPLRISRNVKSYDSFWIKDQNYSMEFLLNKNPLATAFYNGTVYQGFLSPTTYHRLHSPVKGYIYDIEMVDGTYFSQPYFKDEDLLLSGVQPYMAHTATRCIYWIKADNPGYWIDVFLRSWHV